MPSSIGSAASVAVASIYPFIQHYVPPLIQWLQKVYDNNFLMMIFISQFVSTHLLLSFYFPIFYNATISCFTPTHSYEGYGTRSHPIVPAFTFVFFLFPTTHFAVLSFSVEVSFFPVLLYFVKNRSHWVDMAARLRCSYITTELERRNEKKYFLLLFASSPLQPSSQWISFLIFFFSSVVILMTK